MSDSISAYVCAYGDSYEHIIKTSNHFQEGEVAQDADAVLLVQV